MSDTGETSPESPDVAEALRLERGRVLFASPWEFLGSVPSIDRLPPPDGIEIAFAGRSNVGKSSLINALVGRKGLARTSNTPGRTQMLNAFAPTAPGAPALVMIDMPGYGYAKAPKAQVDAWTALVHDYLRGRQNLRRVFLLIDSRHGPKDNDLSVMNELDAAAVSYQIVLTKIDKLKPPAIPKIEAEVARAIARRPAAYPVILSTSSEKGTGLDELRAAIADLAA